MSACGRGADGLLPLLLSLLLISTTWPTTGAAPPDWDSPIFTADTSDEFIKDFDVGNSEITIYEDVEIGHKIGILHFKAQSGDSVTVTQSTGLDDVQLSFDGTNTEQNVYIQSGLDREKTDSIDIGIQLNGGSGRNIILNVADVNDNRPVFDGEWGSQISLNATENQLNDSLLILSATDADDGATATLTYSLDTAGFDDIFNLRDTTKDGNPACQLQLKKELDYEKRPLYKLTITVKDTPDVRGKTQSTSVTVFVNVVDVGDSPPRWLQPPMASSINEGEAKDTELFTVQAIDGDTSVNNAIEYSIIRQNPEGFVNMPDKSTGKVTLTKELDREDDDLKDGFITIVVQAKEIPKEGPDQGCTDISCVNGTALITVNDLDDNPPVIKKDQYTTEWTEGDTGNLDFSIEVTDHDTDPSNNKMTLKLDLGSVPEGVFELTSPSGAGDLLTYIRVLENDYLDYEKEDRKKITFTVVATGNEPNSLSTSTEVTITLKDKNDNSPEFTESKYAFDVKETEVKGATVDTVLATDADASKDYGNSSIRYSIIGSGQWANSLAIDERTGEITVAKDSPFDYESGDTQIQYTIWATDSEGAGSGSLSNSVKLTITVIDVDDTKPELSVQQTDAEVLEEDPNAEIKADISASDEDGDAHLSFSIDWDKSTAKKDGSVVDVQEYDYKSLFEIVSAKSEGGDDANAQLIVQNGGPDREQMDTITLTIVVNDTETKFGKSTDEGQITVNILDKNDNSPYFVNVDESTSFNVTENMPKTSTIGHAILARDVDKENIITYELISGDTDLVAIDVSSGQLSVKDSIDRENKPSLKVTVRATDSDPEPNYNTTEITIKVLDQNDNGPEWVNDPTDVENLNVTENDKEASVYTLKATDADQPGTNFSVITYSLSKGAKKNFTVDPSTGELKVVDALDREVLADQNYLMTIQVFAGDNCDEDGNCAHTTEGLLRIRVLDVNDCPPVFPAVDGFLAQEMETINKGAQLQSVRATDDDEENTDASKLAYELKDTAVTRTGCKGVTDLFEVTTDEGNGQALIKAARDMQGCWGDYNVTLGATDSEDPYNTGTGVYQVRIKDKNDKPNITSPEDNFSFDLSEDSYKGQSMPVPLPNGTDLKVKATDPDDPETDNAVLTYTLLSSSTPDDATDIFYVDGSSGALMMRNKLDRESSNGYEYSLKVEAKDHGDDRLSSTVTIAITITDVDEFPPKFNDRSNNATTFTEEDDARSDIQSITSLATDDDDTDIIFYFLVGGDRDVFELVDSTAEKPQLRNLKKLDYEEKKSYQLILQTTSTNEQPPDVQVFNASDLSQLNVTVNVKDINDMTPDFQDRHFMGGIAKGDQNPSTILRLESYDPDVDDKTTYTITSDFQASEASIANISQPFQLGGANNTEVMLNFDVSDGMDGFFDFQVTATDKKNHKSTTNVRIFIIIEADRVVFVFANPYLSVQSQQNEIADILTDAFSVGKNSYVANIERIEPCDENPNNCTNVITHFIDIDEEEPVSANVIINMQVNNDDITNNLVKDLTKLELTLTRVGDKVVEPPEDSQTVFQMLLIVVGSVLGGVLALTCITSCIHTRKLQRQVKALSINAFGSHESGMQNAGLAVPGSNMFANQGANPIFTMDDKKAALDAESVSSGDSVLIGVEDDPEFANTSRSAGKRPAPSAPVAHANPVFQADDLDDMADTRSNYNNDDGGDGGDDYDDDDDHHGGNDDDHDDYEDVHSGPAVFDENSHHHMPSFDPDDDEDVAGVSPFSGGGGGGMTQNPLFGAEMSAEGDLSEGVAGQF